MKSAPVAVPTGADERESFREEAYFFLDFLAFFAFLAAFFAFFAAIILS
jgi:hypothetical protein